jgi:hypothetical protein
MVAMEEGEGVPWSLDRLGVEGVWWSWYCHWYCRLDSLSGVGCV